jgi:hypothetical protein
MLAPQGSGRRRGDPDITHARATHTGPLGQYHAHRRASQGRLPIAHDSRQTEAHGCTAVPVRRHDGRQSRGARAPVRGWRGECQGEGEGVVKRTSRDPWCRVEHIEIHEGPKGGRYYWLRLECGHFKSVTIPNFCFIRPKLHLAPRRCRCWHCGNSNAADQLRVCRGNAT